jgi:NYN domain
VDRCALFVDAGYLLADGSMAVHGTRHRETVSWDFGGLLQLLGNLARERTGMPLLRCYWYEATVEGRRAPEHEALADLPGLKLRLGRVRPGRSEGVDTEIHRDLMTLARNGAIADAVLVSGDEDLSQVISDAQDLGVRVTVVHVAVDGNWTISRMLRQECDDLIEIGSGHLRPYVTLLAGVDSSSTALSNGHGSSGMGSSFGSSGFGSGSSGYSSGSGSGGYSSGSGSSGYNAGSGSGGYSSGSGSGGYSSGSGSGGYSSGSGGYTSGSGAGSYGSGSGSSMAPLPSSGPYSSPPPSSPIIDRYPTPQLSAPTPSSSSGSNSSSSSPGVSQHPLVSGALSSPAPKPTPPPPPSQAPSIPSPAPAPPQPQSYLGQSGNLGQSGSSYSSTSLSPSSPPQRGGSTGSGSTGLPAGLPAGVPRPGAYTGPQQMAPAPVQPSAPTLSDAVKAAHQEGQDFGESVARDAPALWLEAVLARKPRMPSDLEARLLQGSSLPIDFLLHDEVRHALRRGFWDALERSRR